MIFSQAITHWYEKNKRDLPWRNINDPYLIWLSEIILQQTRVEQGLPYYQKFAENFPTIKHLAKADEKKILKLWQGLGYYSRARNLHTTAKIISAKHKGVFPGTYNELIKLKGIGPYTASAIASFAFAEAKAVVDGNVYRLLSRYFGIKTPIDTTKAKKEFAKLAQQLIDKKNPARHNQAIMEFGSKQCKPKNPDCENCPLHESCAAFAKKIVDELPAKTKKIKTRNRYFNYVVINYRNKFYIKQRTENDIWKGLYDFPLIETAKQTKPHTAISIKEFSELIPAKKIAKIHCSKIYKHVLSHQKLYAQFFNIAINSPLKNKRYIAVNASLLKKYALPRLIELYLSDTKNVSGN